MNDIARDTIINKLLTYYNINNGILLYNILCTNPIDIVVGIIASKFGVSKVIVTLIIAFLL